MWIIWAFAFLVVNILITFEWDLCNQGKLLLCCWLRHKLKRWYLFGGLTTIMVQIWYFWSMWITYGFSCVCLSSWLASQPSCEAKTLTWQTFSTNIFHTWHAYRHHWLWPFYITFTDLDFGLGSQGQGKAKSIGFIFLHTFQLILMKFDTVFKQFKLNILMLLFGEI